MKAEEQKQDAHLVSEHPVKRPGSRCEEAISRILSPCWRAPAGVAIIYPGQQLPAASSNQPGGSQTSSLQGKIPRRTATHHLPSPSYLVLLQMGFTRPAGHPAAGELLPHHFTLTRRYDASPRQAVCFCGTFLQVTLTGRYPASCSVEFGLSSNCSGTPCSPRLPVFLTSTFPRVAYIPR